MEAIKKYKRELFMELKNSKVESTNNYGPKELSNKELATVGGMWSISSRWFNGRLLN